MDVDSRLVIEKLVRKPRNLLIEILNVPLRRVRFTGREIVPSVHAQAKTKSAVTTPAESTKTRVNKRDNVSFKYQVCFDRFKTLIFSLYIKITNENKTVFIFPGTCCYCAPVVVNVTTTTVVVTTKPITEEVTTTPVEKTTAATKTTPEPATAPTTAQVDTTAEVVETTESYTEPIDYTTTAPTTAPEATTNMTTTRSTFTTTPKSSRCIFKGIDMDRPSVSY